VVQLVSVESVAVHRVVVPETKVTVPVSEPGIPVSASVATSPKSIVSEDENPSAVIVNGVPGTTCARRAPPLAEPAAGDAELDAVTVADCPWPAELAAGVAEPNEEWVVADAPRGPGFPGDGAPDDGAGRVEVTAGVPVVPLAAEETPE
jgi:hypothetical protein